MAGTGFVCERWQQPFDDPSRCSAAICGVEYGGVYLDYTWPLNYFEQQHCLLSQEACTLATTPKTVGIGGCKLPAEDDRVLAAFKTDVVSMRSSSIQREKQQHTARRTRCPALCTGAATARDNRCCVARGLNLCGRHLQSPVVHVQAVGDFPSEPIWLDAGTVSTASSSNFCGSN